MKPCKFFCPRKVAENDYTKPLRIVIFGLLLFLNNLVQLRATGENACRLEPKNQKYLAHLCAFDNPDAKVYFTQLHRGKKVG